MRTTFGRKASSLCSSNASIASRRPTWWQGLSPILKSSIATVLLRRNPLASRRNSSIHVGAAIFRRSVFDRIGLFDESLMYAEDGDLLLRIIEAQVPFVILNTPTLYYRRHGDSMMNS